MVESAVADVVGPAVTTEDPLAAGRDEVLVVKKFLAVRAVGLLHERNDLVSHLAGDLTVLLVLKPLPEQSLYFIRALVAVEGGGHEVGHRLAGAVGADLHSEAELGVVLEQGVLPSRAMTLGVGAIRRGRE